MTEPTFNMRDFVNEVLAKSYPPPELKEAEREGREEWKREKENREGKEVGRGETR